MPKTNQIPTIKIVIEAIPIEPDVKNVESVIEYRLQRLFDYWKENQFCNLILMDIDWQEGNEE